MITYKRSDRNITELLAPEHRLILDQSMQMLLRQVQWAALHTNSQMYKKLLQQLNDNMQEIFPGDSQINKSMQQGLNELYAFLPEQEMPQVDQTLKLVRQLISTREQH